MILVIHFLKDRVLLREKGSQNKEGILPVATLMWPNWRFWGRGVFFDVYEADENFGTSGAKMPPDLDLQETYRAIDSVANGRIPSLFCAESR